MFSRLNSKLLSLLQCINNNFKRRSIMGIEDRIVSLLEDCGGGSIIQKINNMDGVVLCLIANKKTTQ